MLKGKNITGRLIAVMYCLVMFELLVRAPEGQVAHHPMWYYSMIPLGAVIIYTIFDKFVKFDFFKEDER